MSPTNREQLTAELRRLQAAIHASRLEGARLLMDVDLTIPQLKVLLELSHNETLTMGGLASELGVTLSACTHLVDKLVRAGLVERNPDVDDRRVVRCAITDEGRALIERLRQSVPFGRPEFIERMSDDDLRTVVQAMSIVERIVSEMREAAAQ